MTSEGSLPAGLDVEPYRCSPCRNGRHQSCVADWWMPSGCDCARSGHVKRLLGDGSACDGCGADRPDLAAIILPAEEHGFCSVECMAGYVSDRWLD